MTNQEIEIECFGSVLENPQPWQTEALDVLFEMNKFAAGRYFLKGAIDQVKAAALLKSVQTKKGTFNAKKMKKLALALTRTAEKSDAHRNPSTKGV